MTSRWFSKLSNLTLAHSAHHFRWLLQQKNWVTSATRFIVSNETDSRERRSRAQSFKLRYIRATNAFFVLLCSRFSLQTLRSQLSFKFQARGYLWMDPVSRRNSSWDLRWLVPPISASSTLSSVVECLAVIPGLPGALSSRRKLLVSMRIILSLLVRVMSFSIYMVRMAENNHAATPTGSWWTYVSYCLGWMLLRTLVVFPMLISSHCSNQFAPNAPRIPCPE